MILETDWFLVFGVAFILAFVLSLAKSARNARRRAKSVPPLRTCRTCVHFDPEQMKAEFGKHPAFMQAARVLSPAEMAYTRAHDEDGQRVGLLAPKEALRMRWEHFGVCAEHGEGRHRDDSCAKYEPRRESQEHDA